MYGIAYVEMYVRDLAETTEYFTNRWDFSVAAEARRPDRSSVLLRAGEIRLVLSAPRDAGDEIRAWLGEHGEGVADVATYVPDVDQITAAAVEAGLPVLPHDGPAAQRHVRATVGGPGSIRHTVLTADAPAAPSAPPGFPWTRPRPALGRRPGARPHASRLGVIDHIAVCLPLGTLPATAEVYGKVFGLHEISRETVRVGAAGMDSRVLRDTSGAVTYVVIEPTPDSHGGQIEQFTAVNRGAGVQHLAFTTSGICAAVTAYAEQGVAFCPTPETYYAQLARRLPDHRREIEEQLNDLRRTGVLVTSDHGGLLHQIFSTSPHQGGLFYELIERGAGATGFGSDNIAALFAARAAETSAEMGIAG